MKKRVFILFLALCLIIQPRTGVEAQSMEVTIESATMTSRSATVKGSTEALAVMVRITDASGNIVAMQSFAVSADGNFTASITGVSFASGTYKIAVADYEGGEWTTVDAQVNKTPSGDSSDKETEPASGEGGTSQEEGETEGGSFEKITTDEESGEVGAVFDAGEIGEDPVDMSFVADPANEEDAALIDSLFTEEEKAAFNGEPVVITLSVSTSKLSSDEEKTCTEGMEALESMMADGASQSKDVIVNDELKNVFSGELSGPVDEKGKAGDPEITIAQVFDFKVTIKVGDKAPVVIHDLGTAKMVVNFLIDKKFMNNDPNVRRIFFMLHLREDGENEVLPVNVDADTLTGTTEFETCSTFILCYTDVAEYSEAGDVLRSTKYNAKYKVIEGGNVAGKTGVLEYIAPLKKKASHSVRAKVTIDNITYKVTTIAANAFKGNKTISKVTIGQNITAIGANAFRGCTALKNVTISKSVRSIGDRAFFNAGSLKKVTIKSKKLKAENIGKSVWKKTGTKGSITFIVPKSKVKSYTKLFGKFGTVKGK